MTTSRQTDGIGTHHRIRAALVAVLLGIGLALLGAGPTSAGPSSHPTDLHGVGVGAGDGSTTSTTHTGPSTDEDVDQGIIPQPNSGREPDEAGDRGGALQLGLLALILAGVGVIVALVVRESRRARRSPV